MFKPGITVRSSSRERREIVRKKVPRLLPKCRWSRPTQKQSRNSIETSSYRQETRGDKNGVTHEAATATDSLPRLVPSSSAHPRCPSSPSAMTWTTTTLVFWATASCPTVQVPIFARCSGGTPSITNNISPRYRQARLASPDKYSQPSCRSSLPRPNVPRVSRRANLSEEWQPRRLPLALCSSVVSYITTSKDRPRLMTLLGTTGSWWIQLYHAIVPRNEQEDRDAFHSIPIERAKVRCDNPP